jgi:serine/threonine protein kinase
MWHERAYCFRAQEATESGEFVLGQAVSGGANGAVHQSLFLHEGTLQFAATKRHHAFTETGQVLYGLRIPLEEQRQHMLTEQEVAQSETESINQFVDELVREAEALFRLDHVNIERFFAVGVTDRLRGILIPEFVVAEWIGGGTLEGWVECRRVADRPSQAELLRVFAEVADALAYMHEQGYIHRDIKPANLMLTHMRHIKVCDFGVARFRGAGARSNLTQTGTPAYTDPVIFISATYTKSVDIYSLGCTMLHSMQAKVRLFLNVLHPLCNSHPPPPPHISSYPTACTPPASRSWTSKRITCLSCTASPSAA